MLKNKAQITQKSIKIKPRSNQVNLIQALDHIQIQ